jgi:hypothetical protein
LGSSNAARGGPLLVGCGNLCWLLGPAWSSTSSLADRFFFATEVWL